MNVHTLLAHLRLPAASGRRMHSARALFLSRTYAHLLGALSAFALLEVLLFKSGVAHGLARVGVFENWLVVLGACVVVSWLGSHLAARATTLAAQYAGLVLYVCLQAVIFVPLLSIALLRNPGSVAASGFTTLLLVGALTAIAFVSRHDFSYLGTVVKWGFACALVLLVVSLLVGFSLGLTFSVLMVGLAGAAILHKTSQLLLHAPHERHVAAALELFASVVLMFWYVLRILQGGSH